MAARHRGLVLRYQLRQLAKFVGVLLFVGGAIASFVARDGDARRAAVHRLGSIGLLVTLLHREGALFCPGLCGQ